MSVYVTGEKPQTAAKSTSEMDKKPQQQQLEQQQQHPKLAATDAVTENIKFQNFTYMTTYKHTYLFTIAEKIPKCNKTNQTNHTCEPA